VGGLTRLGKKKEGKKGGEEGALAKVINLRRYQGPEISGQEKNVLCEKKRRVVGGSKKRKGYNDW